MAHPCDIVGYTYQASTFCPECIASQVDGRADLPAEQVLDALAADRHIERQNEYTFDSDDFPKVIFRDSAGDEEECEHCHALIG